MTTTWASTFRRKSSERSEHGARDNERYCSLITRVLATKRGRGGVLGFVHYLRGIRDFAAFRCHPLLMPTIRPDGRMYYPVSRMEAGRR